MTSNDQLETSSFSPLAESGKLREQLSIFDRPIVFLVGAGASASVECADGSRLIPAVIKLTSDCREEAAGLGAWASLLWDGMIEDISARSSSEPALVNIEDILSELRNKLGSMSLSDKSRGADRDQVEQLEQLISTHIRGAADPPEARIPESTPHDALARWISRIQRAGSVEIFTTNYDTLLERALEKERVPVFDGFVGSRLPFFYPASLAHIETAPAASWTRLWKVHGSINWKLINDPVRGDRIVRQLPGGEAHLILPSSQKYDQSRKLPYIAMLDRLTKSLANADGTLLIVVGFSFGDQHINEILVDALESESRTHIVALQFEDPVPGGHLETLARKYSNLVVYSPTRALVGGVDGTWELTDPVSSRSAQLIDLIFDSDAVPGEEREVSGQWRLGDFHWFGQFLDRISAKRG